MLGEKLKGSEWLVSGGMRDLFWLILSLIVAIGKGSSMLVRGGIRDLICVPVCLYCCICFNCIQMSVVCLCPCCVLACCSVVLSLFCCVSSFQLLIFESWIMYCLRFVLILSHHRRGSCIGLRRVERWLIFVLIKKMLLVELRIESFNFQWEDLKGMVEGFLVWCLEICCDQ